MKTLVIASHPYPSQSRVIKLVVTSAGASEHAYSAEGSVRSTINDVLTPMKASALYVGMKYLEPLVLYNAAGTDDKALNEFCEKFAGCLENRR